jgi:hypothetical protein
MTTPTGSVTPGAPLKTYQWASLLGAFLVGGIAATASWSHMVGVALMVGERSWVAHILPLSVDGLLLTSVCTLAYDKAMGYAPRWSARIFGFIGVTASLVANVAHAQPTLGGRIVAAWPAIALYGVVEILTRRPRVRRQKMSAPPVQSAPDIPADKPQVARAPVVDIPAASVTAPKAARVSALASKHPTLNAAELAALAKVSDKTARRVITGRVRTPKATNGQPFLDTAETGAQR